MASPLDKEVSTSPTEQYEKAYRTHHPNIESNSPLGIGVDLEKQWTPAGDSLSSDNSSLSEPEPTKSKSNEEVEQPAPLTGTSTARRVVTAQDWDGPDDPENPQNWPLWKRVYHTIPPALFAFAVTFGSSVYTPAYHEIAERFNVSPTASLLGVTLYVFGLGLGPMIASPISETFGRQVVYRFSLPVSALFTLGAGFSTSFGSLLVCRFFAGATGSPVLAVGAGTLADLFPPRIRARATSSFLMSPFLGPSIGPFLGGFVAQYKNWKWTNWITLFILVGCYASSLGMQETYKKIILQKRAKRLNIAPPKQVFPPGLAGLKFIMTVTLLRPVTMLFLEPIVGFMSLYNAFTFSILFAFFEAFPLVFGGIYGFSISQVGISFLAVAVGVILAVVTALFIDVKVYLKKHQAAVAEGKTAVAPEHRLYAAMYGAFGISIGLFWFAWTSRHAVHWIVPIIATIPFAWGNTLIFIAAALYLVDVYGPLNGASAMAANGLLRYGMSAVFPLFTVQMYKTLSIPWASSLLGFLSLLMLPIPFILFRFGPKIREKSRYDTIKA